MLIVVGVVTVALLALRAAGQVSAALPVRVATCMPLDYLVRGPVPRPVLLHGAYHQLRHANSLQLRSQRHRRDPVLCQRGCDMQRQCAPRGTRKYNIGRSES